MLKEVWDTFIPDIKRNTYDHFKYLGYFKVMDQPSFVDYEMKPGNLVCYMSQPLFEEIDSWAADLVVTRSTFETLDLSVRKMDRLPTYTYLECVHYPDVLRKFHDMWSDILTVEHLSLEETIHSIDWDKSPGFIPVRSGFRFKRDWFLSGHLPEIFEPELLTEVSLWSASGKVENKLRLKYVDKKKQRDRKSVV